MNALFDKDEVSLVVTDSGLGGLSVAADCLERLTTAQTFRRARVVFFNCLPAAGVGFDGMESDRRRIRVFDRALECMAERFSPDAMVIACNTLSVLYDKTAFAGRAPCPVQEIVGMGVDLIAQHLRSNPGARVVLLGAPTTVQSGVHARLLAAQGIGADRLVCQSCHGLISAIERAPDSASTRALIRRHVREALGRLPDRAGPVAVSLNCTHFGYVRTAFRDAFRSAGIEPTAILDPTPDMAALLLAGAPTGRFASGKATIEVVGQTPIGPERKQSIGALIASHSPRAAAALRRDKCLPGLFAIS